MKPFLKVCFSVASLLVVSAPGWAATSARYRIDLQDGSRVYARDVPVRRGTILTFHQHPGGALTGLPQELVLRVEPESGAARIQSSARVIAPNARPKLGGRITNGLQPGEILVVGPNDGLKPGEVLVLGPTGEGGGIASQQPGGATGMNGAAQGGGAYGGNLNTNGAMVIGPNGLPVAPSSTDLGRAQTGGQTAIAPKGSPNGAPTTIGPDGTPILSPGVPGSSTPAAVGVPVIGPNGTPVVAQPGAPGTVPPAIGPNGTPVLAPPGGPGAKPQTIGPNGTPVTAPAGAPGSAQPNTAPNGTNAAPAGAPASPPAGPPAGSSAPPSDGSSPN